MAKKQPNPFFFLNLQRCTVFTEQNGRNIISPLQQKRSICMCACGLTLYTATNTTTTTLRPLLAFYWWFLPPDIQQLCRLGFTVSHALLEQITHDVTFYIMIDKCMVIVKIKSACCCSPKCNLMHPGFIYSLFCFIIHLKKTIKSAQISPHGRGDSGKVKLIGTL